MGDPAVGDRDVPSGLLGVSSMMRMARKMRARSSVMLVQRSETGIECSAFTLA